MLSVKTASLAGGGDLLFRRQFITQIKEVVPSIRVLWAPNRYDGTLAYTDEATGPRAITWDANVSGRLTKQGHGYLQTFDGAANFGSAPDTADLTFGNGVTDSAFSIVALANVTDTAAARNLLAKWNATGSQREYVFNVASTDVLVLNLRDEALAVTPFRASDAAITQGSPHLFACTYDGTGGATAANGIVLYQDAAVIASTATNQATYVATADKTGALEFGAQTAGTASFMAGSMGFALVCAGVLSLAQMVQIKGLCNTYFGLAL